MRPKPIARIGLSVAQNICNLFTKFTQTNKIQTYSNQSPSSYADVSRKTETSDILCKELKWQTCDGCEKFTYVNCKYSSSNFKPNMKKRARNTKTARIVGGHDASPNQHPYHVRLDTVIDEVHYPFGCSGVIYNSMYVLTAASCIKDLDPCMITVIAGDHRVNEVDNTEQERRVVSIIVHEAYTKIHIIPEHDIALLKLTYPFNFTKHVQPIQVATQEYPNKDTVFAEISGWGYKGPTIVDYSDVLQTDTIPLLDECDCKLYFTFFDDNSFSSKKLCVGSLLHGFCHGDFGSPVTVTDKGIKYLAGIASFSGFCGRTIAPGILTKILAYQDWITMRAGAQM